MTVVDDGAVPAGLGEPILELLNGFVVELRNAGIPVSLTENLDAMLAVKHIPLEDREAFKYALAATMVKNQSHWKAFETVFEIYFSLRGDQYDLNNQDGQNQDGDDQDQEGDGDQEGEGEGEGQGRGGGGNQMTPEELAQLLYQALMSGDRGLMKMVAKVSVKRFAGMEPGRPVGGTYYLYRTLRNLDRDGVMAKLMEQAREEVGGEMTPLEQRLTNDESENRADIPREEIGAANRRHSAQPAFYQQPTQYVHRVGLGLRIRLCLRALDGLFF